MSRQSRYGLHDASFYVHVMICYVFNSQYDSVISSEMLCDHLQGKGRVPKKKPKLGFRTSVTSVTSVSP